MQISPQYFRVNECFVTCTSETEASEETAASF
jgi:hypothetical protein